MSMMTLSSISFSLIEPLDNINFGEIAGIIIAGVFLLTVLIPAVAVERQTASFVFTSFYKPDLGISSSPYIFFLGLLMSQYSLAGFDASAHMVRHGIPLESDLLFLAYIIVNNKSSTFCLDQFHCLSRAAAKT
jgi:hypothetical protein